MGFSTSMPSQAILRWALKLAKRHVITDYDEFLKDPAPRRALLSYLVHPLLPPSRLREKVQFSNKGIAQEIPRALNELGYTVDILDFHNKNWTPSRQYDLFIGHGGVNFAQISAQLQNDAVRIYFATGVYWRELNVRAAKALYELALRKGVLISPERFVLADEESANNLAHGIICLGNDVVRETYSKFANVISVNNAAFAISQGVNSSKDFSAGKRHFLFFSGRGNVHRGLDLLLEVFASIPDLHLHICQHIEPQFASVYRDELHTKNIHVYGFTKMRSAEFYRLANLCNWIILPTRAEGQPGSVVECMAHGLIPILPDSAGIDLEDFGILIPKLNVQSIRQIVMQTTEMSANRCQQLSQRTMEVCRQNYSVLQFRESIKHAICEIVPTHDQSRNS